MSQSSQEFSPAAEKASAELDDVLQTARRLDQRLVGSIRGTVLALLNETKRRTAKGEEFAFKRIFSLAMSPLVSKGKNWNEFFRYTETDRRERISMALKAVDSEITEAESAPIEALVASLEFYIRAQSEGLLPGPFVFQTRRGIHRKGEAEQTPARESADDAQEGRGPQES
jgi:hypothetical protein